MDNCEIINRVGDVLLCRCFTTGRFFTVVINGQ